MATGGNLTTVFHEPGQDFKLVDAPIPEPQENEVVLEVHSVGICGTDIHMWRDGSIGGIWACESPFTMGHEFSGTVVRVGSKATRLAIGDRVSGDPTRVCHSALCEACFGGRYHLCPHRVIAGCVPQQDGALRRYHACLEQLCHKLPDDVSLEQGAFAEPLSVAVHACRRAKVSYGSFVLIGGCGPIGMLCLMAARAMGAAKICVTDVKEDRLRLARELGADLTLLVADSNYKGPSEGALEVQRLFGRQPDIALECTGTDPSLQLAILATKSGGTVAMVGLGDAMSKVPLVAASSKELLIKGCILSPHSFPTAIEMISSGKAPVHRLVSHRFALQRASEAFRLAVSGAPGTMKVLIQPGVSP